MGLSDIMESILNAVPRSLVTLIIYILDILIPISRFIRYCIWLPLTPITEPLVKKFFHQFGISFNGKSPQDIIVKNKGFYARFLADGQLGMDEMYAEGWWTCGDLQGMVANFESHYDQLCWYLKWHISTWESKLRWSLFNIAGLNGTVSAQYQLPDAYYKLIGGPTLQHSTGYYPKGDETVAEAAIAKFKLIAKKLGLKKGMTLLDIGCGFGGLAKYMADNYGVHAVGITSSEVMRQAAADHCGDSNVKILHQDWTQISGQFDRIVIIEMSEHVGWHNQREFYKKIASLLKPGGLCLNQCWVMAPHMPRYSDYMSKYLYGQIYFPALGEIIKYSQDYVEIMNFENLRDHGVLNLRDFINYLKTNQAELESFTLPSIVKGMMITYAWAELGLRNGTISIHHIVFKRRDNHHNNLGLDKKHE